MPRRNILWLVGVTGISFLCWAIAQTSIAAPRGPTQLIKGLPGYNLDFENLELLVDVLQHVELSYVHELSEEERRNFIEAAITGGLQSLDQHSSFLSTRDFEQFQRTSNAEFGGVGIQIHVDRQTKILTVISPIVGTPAYKAGLKPGDTIEKVDGASTEGMSIHDAVEKIQGPPGSEVVLTIRHRGASNTIDKKLVRSKIEVDSILGDLRDEDDQWDFMADKENRIGYIRITQFGRKTADELKQVLSDLSDHGARGLILDVRNNPGGLLNVAVEIANMFISQGKIVSIEGRNGLGDSMDAQADSTVIPPKAALPIAVLINGNSASASEILAAALQDHGRATIIGQRSFGKGSVQNLIAMEGGKSALKITTAKYLRPSGKNIHRFPGLKEEDDWGVRPDEEVKMTLLEEVRYLTGRQDRDIVRDGDMPPEHVGKLSSLTAPLWRFTPGNSLWGTLISLSETAKVYEDLPKDSEGNPIELIPLPYKDKVLDRAMELIMERL